MFTGKILSSYDKALFYETMKGRQWGFCLTPCDPELTFLKDKVNFLAVS